ncbi:hypothetical protein EUA93_07995 [Nocardioides oleivorans]|uniref:Uncharacterized protein n=1 Tax=Nocardioides oleivorans TaxID=273676 RepID=A0A4Q2S1U2_9ACTN|nr:hypothetical protein [Nocardioides oleivorans]RYB94289.1 hypothetical protein EUA93_07995 [Nocardioides oleivorans]
MEDEQPARRARWVVPVAVAAVALVVTGAFALPRLVDRGSGPAAAPTTDCVATTDARPTDIGNGQVSWVRFCPPAGPGTAQLLRHPQGVVTGDLAASIAGTLWETQADRPVCDAGEAAAGPAGPPGHFRIEVGLADGRVAELAGDVGCSTRDALLFSQLETTLLMDAASRSGSTGAPVPDPVTCPERLTTEETNRDGASADQLVETDPGTVDQPWLSTTPILAMPAVAVDVCAYAGRGRGLRLVEQWQGGSAQAEQIRSTATVAHWRGAMADCDVDRPRPSYVVVLTDATGTARTLTIDGRECGALDAAIGTPATDTWLGLAAQALIDSVASSRT